MNKNSQRMRVGKYELGRTLGEGTFAKVKFAKNLETGQSVAIKVLDKDKILKHKMVQQIKREISTMKLVKHPYIVQLLEVMASKTKIYIVLEYVTGGGLFDKIPENLLVDANGNLKISDFGFSALSQQCRADGLLHTTCGTPNYVAPEVINDKGYHGSTADLWSCGGILFVLMAGYLPFNGYKKINRPGFTCRSFFSAGARRLIMGILDPNPKTRITTEKIYQNNWFKKEYSPPKFEKDLDINLDDIDAVFSESTDYMVTEEKDIMPPAMIAFELLSLSWS
uniref:Protein kinase domain-containing protein n=1 Tax=Physcomitrium patens TaxID=3218 RepID=A0A7I4FJ99_PHYPA